MIMKTTINTNNNINLIGEVMEVKKISKRAASITLALENIYTYDDTIVVVKSLEPDDYENLEIGMLIHVAAHLTTVNLTGPYGDDTYDETSGMTYDGLDIIADSIQFLARKKEKMPHVKEKDEESESMIVRV